MFPKTEKELEIWLLLQEVLEAKRKTKIPYSMLSRGMADVYFQEYDRLKKFYLEQATNYSQTTNS